VAAAYQSARLLGKFDKALVPLLGQAFRSQPLREKARSSVVGITASWGHERYRFDEDWCLLGCGIDPSAGELRTEAAVVDSAQQAFWLRATSIFSDLALQSEQVMRWGALFTTTCDGLPLLGPLPGEPRLHVVAGFATSAWSRGVAAGDQVASHLLGEVDASPLVARCSTRRLF
jgi:glycine/D-amino acid oxidase-like deaminating enzyme